MVSRDEINSNEAQHMNRHPVPSEQSYSRFYFDGERYMFSNFGPEKNRIRSCGVFSCSQDELAANVSALKGTGYRVFNSAGAEL